MDVCRRRARLLDSTTSFGHKLRVHLWWLLVLEIIPASRLMIGLLRTLFGCKFLRNAAKGTNGFQMPFYHGSTRSQDLFIRKIMSEVKEAVSIEPKVNLHPTIQQQTNYSRIRLGKMPLACHRVDAFVGKQRARLYIYYIKEPSKSRELYNKYIFCLRILLLIDRAIGAGIWHREALWYDREAKRTPRKCKVFVWSDRQADQNSRVTHCRIKVSDYQSHFTIAMICLTQKAPMPNLELFLIVNMRVIWGTRQSASYKASSTVWKGNLRYNGFVNAYAVWGI